MRRGMVAWATLVCLASPGAAEDGTVYRWTDRDGRVNYGSTPPPGVKATELQGRGRVSVVPAIVVPRAPAAPIPSEGERLERLERELEAERAQRREREEEEIGREARQARLRAECEEKYREPCDAFGQPAGPRYILVPARPPHRSPGGRDGRPGTDKPRPRPLEHDRRLDARPPIGSGGSPPVRSERTPPRRPGEQSVRPVERGDLTQ